MRIWTPALCAAVLTLATSARAFPHIMRQGETLSQIAARVYGDAKLEVILAGANYLDAQGGSAPVPGMRLEVPAPSYHRVEPNQTWAKLALTWLGDARRADILARYNRAVAWVPPVEGQEIEIPFVLTVIAAEGDRIDALAARYLGDANRAWEVEAYNLRKGTANSGAPAPKRGDVLLFPLIQLQLTEQGKAEARRGRDRDQGQGSGNVLEVQRRAEGELPVLLTDVRGGRYVEAVARGHRLLGSGELTRAQQAVIHRALLEAFVALDAVAGTAASCAAWRSVDPAARLDPVMVSPKVRAACPERDRDTRQP